MRKLIPVVIVGLLWLSLASPAALADRAASRPQGMDGMLVYVFLAKLDLHGGCYPVRQKSQ